MKKQNSTQNILDIQVSGMKNAWKSQSHINVYKHICKMCMHTCACQTHENET